MLTCKNSSGGAVCVVVIVGVTAVAVANCVEDCTVIDKIISDADNGSTYCLDFAPNDGNTYYQDIYSPNTIGGDVATMKLVDVDWYAESDCYKLCSVTKKPQAAVLDPYHLDPVLTGQGIVGEKCDKSTGGGDD